MTSTSMDVKMICADYGFIISKTIWISLLTFLFLAVKYEPMFPEYYQLHNITNEELMTQTINDFLIILCYAVFAISITIAQMWKYVNIYYFYASSIANIISDTFNSIVMLYIVAQFDNNIALIIALVIFTAYIICNCVQMAFVCGKKKLDRFLVPEREQVIKVYPLREAEVVDT